MTTTINTIAELLDEAQVNHRVDDDSIVTAYATQSYRNPDGEASLRFRIRVLGDGQALVLTSPHAYNITGEHVSAALETCLRLQWENVALSYGYDYTDGELQVRFIAPLVGIAPTRELIEFIIGTFIGSVETAHGRLAAAIETGVMPERQISPIGPALARLLGRLNDLDDDRRDHVTDVLASLDADQFAALVAAITSASDPS